MTDSALTDYGFRLLTDEEYDSWYERSEASLSIGSPFHHPAWLTAVARGLDRRLVRIAADSSGGLVAVIPGWVERRGPVRLFGSPLRGTMTSYLGPAILGDSRDCSATRLVQASHGFVRREFGVSYARFTMRSAPEGELDNLGTEWRQQRPKSYRLDLTQGVDAVWAGLTSDCRRNIRRAEREGIEIVPLEDPRLFYRLLDATMRRHGSTSSHPVRFFESIFEEPRSVGLLHTFAAVHGSTVVSAGIFLRDHAELHYLSGASDPRFGSLPTSYALHWHAIREAIAAGTRVFNSDASRIRSIDRFKESFRPSLERRHTMIWASRGVYQAQKRAIAVYHRFRSVKARLGEPRS